MSDDYEDIMEYCDLLEIACENPYDELFYDYDEEYDDDGDYYEDYRE